MAVQCSPAPTISVPVMTHPFCLYLLWTQSFSLTYDVRKFPKMSHVGQHSCPQTPTPMLLNAAYPTYQCAVHSALGLFEHN